ncbi:helix-turn-helix domain-containing protein [Paucisalibacillus globulus]|uniref:helix-turn-helix domain-containing protein n=1 Tax=Paucisalibacillus globulus TaxID=351095 RepID=UPI000BB8C9CE|nr:helix-turn-helix transcriptional regulator [Paucisalibacillus globulus]
MAGYNKFKGLLVELGIRQTEIADLLGMNRSSLNSILNGQGRDFKVSEVRTICEHLNISPEVYFFNQKVSN